MKTSRRKCKAPGCGAWFHPAYSNIYWCCSEHRHQVIAIEREKQRSRVKRCAEKKAKREELRKQSPEPISITKPLSHWLELTERAVNVLCRELALFNGEGCISCGTHRAHVWHAGHYRTVAAAGHLRFTRININLQCDDCNINKSGNIKAYRIGLVAKIGETAVQQLENDNRIYRWTVEELEEIRHAAYAELRELKKQLEAA